MKIVVLDGHTLNPGDLSWTGFEKMGETIVYERSDEKEVIDRAKDADVVFTNKVPLSRETIESLSKLKYIGVLATGYNIVDTSAAAELGIPVSNIPTYGTDSVAQMVFAHLLNLTQRVAYHDQTVKEGRWSKSQDFCYWDYPLVELSDLTMGVIGYGRIGRTTASLARAFGMRVIAHDEYAKDTQGSAVTFLSLQELFRDSDVVSLHCPLLPSTEGVVNAEHLALMKPTAFLINTSRGPLVKEEDLATALNEGQIAGAGLDVVAEEPIRTDNPLLWAQNCFITPHIAWATKSARSRLMDIAVSNLKSHMDGSSNNIVNDVTK